MDMNSFADLRPDGNEQELHSYTKWLAVFGFMLGSLLTFLGWKYQGPERFSNAVKKFLNQCGTPLLRHSKVYVIGFNRISMVYVIGFDRASKQFGQHLRKHPMDPQCLHPT
ncbi:hypothetical protein SO802_009279 [Lithocarpus litseifolius]|uniref:Uncharacterized protein n=1 Tax=Lithocarpus litseifolius TaxID=425828 RepID=A0AAW2DAZ2_9ROSI